MKDVGTSGWPIWRTVGPRLEKTNNAYRACLQLHAQEVPPNIVHREVNAAIFDALESQDVRGEMVRPVDYDIKPGITSDEGPGDAWPDLRKRVMKADIIVVGSPIWLGQPSSVAKRVLERMDAFLGEKDDFGRMPSYGKVGVVNAVGNEDRAHHVAAEALQALIEVGFSVPPGGVAYWVGEATGSVNYIDLKNTPEALADWINMLAANTAHLARILKDCPFPGRPQGIPN